MGRASRPLFPLLLVAGPHQVTTHKPRCSISGPSHSHGYERGFEAGGGLGLGSEASSPEPAGPLPTLLLKTEQATPGKGSGS